MGYFGSKATTGLCQALLGLQPPHDLYIETHLGSVLTVTDGRAIGLFDGIG